MNHLAGVRLACVCAGAYKNVCRHRVNHRNVLSGCLLFASTFTGIQISLASESDGAMPDSTANAASPDTAIIDFVKGYVTVFPENKTEIAVYAKRGIPVQENDRIITGDNGFVSFSFKSGTIVSIQPSSEVNVDKLDCFSPAAHCHITLNVLRGFVNSNVDSESHNDVQFTINTPYASAAVRGTVFDVDVGNERLLAGVTEGQVNVSAASTILELPENFGSEVVKDQPRSPPVALLSAPLFLPSPARYDSVGDLAWNSVAQAHQYLVSLANASGLVYSTNTPETTHQLRKLDVGTYSLNLRAIDNNGFRGRSAQREFDVVDIDTSRVGPVIQGTIDADQFSVSVSPQPSMGDKVEMHLSPTEDFERLINLDASLGEIISADRAGNSIFVRARGILSNTRVTPFGPVFEVPAKL